MAKLARYFWWSAGPIPILATEERPTDRYMYVTPEKSNHSKTPREVRRSPVREAGGVVRAQVRRQFDFAC